MHLGIRTLNPLHLIASLMFCLYKVWLKLSSKKMGFLFIYDCPLPCHCDNSWEVFSLITGSLCFLWHTFELEGYIYGSSPSWKIKSDLIFLKTVWNLGNAQWFARGSSNNYYFWKSYSSLRYQSLITMSPCVLWSISKNHSCWILKWGPRL